MPLQAAGGEVLETVRAVLGSGGNLEASARAIFVHPNTVRYRLKRAAELTGLSATDPRGSWTLQVALALADLDQRPLALALSGRFRPAVTARCGPHHRHGPRRARSTPPFWRNPPKITACAFVPLTTTDARRITGTVKEVLAVLAPGQGAQKPGMLTDWLELPGAESFFRWAGAIADADLLTLGTTGDAEAIKDTAVTQPLVVAMSLFVARELGGLPGPVAHSPHAGRDVVIAGHSVGELTAAALAGVLSVEAAIALTAVRGRAMAAACAQTPDRACPPSSGGDPDEVLAAHRAARPGPGEHERRRPGRRRRAARGAGRAQGRPAGQGADHAAVGRRRLPHRVHGPGPRASWRALVGGLRPADPSRLLLSNADGAAVDLRRRGAVPAGQPGDQPGALRRLPGHDARARRHRRHRAAAGRRAGRAGQARVEGRRTSRSWP